MLDVAIKYIDQVVEKFKGIWFKERYMYYTACNYNEVWEPKESTWVDHQFVSVVDGEVIGYIGYSIDRSAGDAVHGLNIVNFCDKTNVTFAKDMGQAIRNIFERFGFRKLIFSVIIGNPIEKSYDRMCEKYGRRIVGILKANVRLYDGKFYDEKLYEILKEDYFKAIQKG